MSSMTAVDVAQASRELDALILSGQALLGLERFYAEDVVMQENLDAPCVGKAANRKREEEFFASVAEVNEAKLHAQGAGEDVTFSEWTLDVTLKNGQRAKLNQVSVRRWKDGLIVHERFYYKP